MTIKTKPALLKPVYRYSWLHGTWLPTDRILMAESGCQVFREPFDTRVRPL